MKTALQVGKLYAVMYFSARMFTYAPMYMGDVFMYIGRRSNGHQILFGDQTYFINAGVALRGHDCFKRVGKP